jgi:predicted nucleotidyltransferase
MSPTITHKSQLFQRIYQRLGINGEQLDSFCQENCIQELSVFGSVLRDDFNEESDIDILVSYHSSASVGLLESVELREKLSKLFKRKVDLLSKKAIEKSKNWLKKDIILNSAVIIYES